MSNDYALSVEIYDGKYTVIQKQNGGTEALRYGEPWRDCTGDGLILALAQEVQELRDAKGKQDMTDLGAAITDFAKEDLETALQLIGGIFIGLNEVYISMRTDDETAKNKDIVISSDIPGQRKVTIHRLSGH